MRITGTIPATLSDSKIDPPLAFGYSSQDEVPVRVEMTWYAQQ
jgi:hypothetical protein